MKILEVHSVHSRRALSALKEHRGPPMSALTALKQGFPRLPWVHSLNPSKNLPSALAMAVGS